MAAPNGNGVQRWREQFSNVANTEFSPADWERELITDCRRELDEMPEHIAARREKTAGRNSWGILLSRFFAWRPSMLTLALLFLAAAAIGIAVLIRDLARAAEWIKQ